MSSGCRLLWPDVIPSGCSWSKGHSRSLGLTGFLSLVSMWQGDWVMQQTCWLALQCWQSWDSPLTVALSRHGFWTFAVILNSCSVSSPQQGLHFAKPTDKVSCVPV